METTTYDNTATNQNFHPLPALIASATNNELASHVEYLKEEKNILRTRIPGQLHTRPEERERLPKFGKVIGRGIEELMVIVSPSTFYCRIRDEKNSKPKPKNPKGRSAHRWIRCEYHRCDEELKGFAIDTTDFDDQSVPSFLIVDLWKQPILVAMGLYVGSIWKAFTRLAACTGPAFSSEFRAARPEPHGDSTLHNRASWLRLTRALIARG